MGNGHWLLLVLVVLAIFTSVVLVGAVTISFQPSQETQCFDSDIDQTGLRESGRNYFVKGNTSNVLLSTSGQPPTVIDTKTDSCEGIVLKENYCSTPSTAVTESVDCSQINPNFRCVEGACVYIPDFGPIVTEPVTTPTAGPPHGIPCSDTDGGLNLFTKGTAGIQGQTQYEDFCLGETTIQEYFCKQGNIPVPTSLPLNCPDKTECKDGACEQIVIAPPVAEKRTCSKDCPDGEDLAKKYLGSVCALDDLEKPEILDGPFINLTPTIIPNQQPSVRKSECLDKTDNDQDNFTDYPDDVGCKSKFDISETPDIDITVFSESATQFLLDMYRAGKMTGPQAIGFVDNLAVPAEDKPEIKDLLSRFIERQEGLDDIENRLNQAQATIDSNPQTATDILNGVKLDLPAPALPGSQSLPTASASATPKLTTYPSSSITGFQISIKQSDLETIKKLDIVEPNTIIENIAKNQQLLGKEFDTLSSCFDPAFEISQIKEIIRKQPCLAQRYANYISEALGLAENHIKLTPEITNIPAGIFSDIQDFIEKFNDPDGEKQLKEAEEKITKTDDFLRNKKVDLELRKRILRQHPEYKKTESDVAYSGSLSEMYKELNTLNAESDRLARLHFILLSSKGRDSPEVKEVFRSQTQVKAKINKLTAERNKKEKLAEIEQEFQQRGLDGDSTWDLEDEVNELEELANPKTRRQKAQELHQKARNRAAYLKSLDQNKIEEKVSEKILNLEKLSQTLKDASAKIVSYSEKLESIVKGRGCAQSIDTLGKTRESIDNANKYIEALQESNGRAKEIFSTTSNNIQDAILLALQVYQHLMVSSNHAESSLKKISESDSQSHNTIGHAAKCDLPCPLGQLPEYDPQVDGKCVSCKNFYEQKGPYWGPKKWRTPEEILSDEEIAVQRALAKLEEADTPEELDAAKKEYLKLIEAQLEDDQLKKEIMDLENKRIDDYIQKRKDFIDFNNQLAQVVNLVNSGKTSEAKTAFENLKKSFDKIKTSVRGDAGKEITSIGSVIEENLQRGQLKASIEMLEKSTTKEEAETAATAITSITNNATFLDNQTKEKLINQTTELKKAKLTVIKYKPYMDKTEELLRQNQTADAYSFYAPALSEAERTNDVLGIQYIQARINIATGGKGINKADIIIQFSRDGRTEEIEKFLNLAKSPDEKIIILAEAAQKAAETKSTQSDIIIGLLENILQDSPRLKDKFILATVKYQRGITLSERGDYQGIVEWRKLWNESSTILGELESQTLTQEQKAIVTQIKKSIDYNLRLDEIGKDLRGVRTISDLGDVLAETEKDLISVGADLQQGKIDAELYFTVLIKHIDIRLGFWKRQRSTEQAQKGGLHPDGISDLYNTLIVLQKTLRNQALSQDKRIALEKLVSETISLLNDSLEDTISIVESKTESIVTAAVEEEQREIEVRERIEAGQDVSTKAAVDAEIARVEAGLSRMKSGYSGVSIVGKLWHKEQLTSYLEFLKQGVSTDARLALQQHRETLKSLTAIKIELEKSNVETAIQKLDEKIKSLRSHLEVLNVQWGDLYKLQQSTTEGSEKDKIQQDLDKKQQQMVDAEREITRLQYLSGQESSLEFNKKREVTQAEFARLSSEKSSLENQAKKKEDELKREKAKYFWNVDDEKIKSLEKEIKVFYEKLRTAELQIIVVTTPEDSERYSSQDPAEIESSYERVLVNEWTSELYAGTRFGGEESDQASVRRIENQLWVLSQKRQSIAVYRGLQAGRSLSDILSDYYNQRAQILLDEIDRREEIKNQPGATNPTFEILTDIINQNTYQEIALSRLRAELESIRQGQLSVLSNIQQDNTQNHALIISNLIQSQIRLSQAEWTDRFILLEEAGVFRPFVVGFQSAGRGAVGLTQNYYTTTFEQDILSKVDFSKPVDQTISQINNLPEEERKVLSDGRRNLIGYTIDRKDVFDQTAESRKRYAQLLLSISRGGQAVLDTIKQTDKIGYAQLVLTGWVSAKGDLQTPPTLPEWITKSLFDENILPGADSLQANSVGKIGIVVVGGGLAARTGATIIGGLVTGATGSAAAGQTAFWLTFPGLFVPGSNVIGGITYGEKGDYSLKHFASSYLTVWGLGGLGYLGRGLTTSTGLTTAGGELASASLLRGLASNGIHFGFEVMGFWAGGQIMYGFTGDQHDKLTLEQALMTTIGLKIAGLPTHDTFTRFFDALGVKSTEFGDFFGRWYEKYSTTLSGIRTGNLKAEEAMRQLAEQEKILRNAFKRFGIEDQITVEQGTPEAVVNRIIDIIISRRVQKGEGSQQIVDTILNNRIRKGESKTQVDYLRSELLKILQSGVGREEIIYRIQDLGFNRAEAESIITAGEGHQILSGLRAQMSGAIKRNFHLVVDFTNPQQPTGRKQVSREKLQSELLNIGLAQEEVQSIIALLEGGLFVVRPPQSTALATIKREQESENIPAPPLTLPQTKEVKLLSAPQKVPQGEQARVDRQHESADVSSVFQPIENSGNGDGVLSYDLTLPDGRRVTRVVFADAKSHGQSAERLRNIMFDVIWRNRDLGLQEMLFSVDASLATRQQKGGDLGRSDFTTYVIADVDQATGEVEYSRSGNRFLAVNFDPATGKVTSTEPIGNSFPLPIPAVARNKMREDLFNPRMPLNTNKLTLNKGVLVLFSDGFEDSKIGSQFVGREKIEALVNLVVEDVLVNNPSATSEELTDAVLIEWNKFVEENNVEQTDDISLVVIRPKPQLPDGYTTEQYRDLVTSAQRFGKELGFTESEMQTAVAILTDGGFSAPLRHDIRTPATVINGNLDNLQAFGHTEQLKALSPFFDTLTGSVNNFEGSLLDLFYTQYLIYLDTVSGKNPQERLEQGINLPTDKEGALKNFMVLFRKIREEAAKINPTQIDEYASKVTDEKIKKYITTIADNSRRLVLMIEELTGGSTRSIDQWISAFGRKVKLDIPAEASRYVTNARMVQLMINLVSNSERAANERGIKLDAALTIEIQGGVAVLTYADNAGGIDLQGILDSAKNSPNRQLIERNLGRALDSLDPTNPADKPIIARLILEEGVTTKEQEPGMHGIGMAGVKTMLEKAAKEQGLDSSNVIEIFLVDKPPGTGFKITVPVMLLGDVLSQEEVDARAEKLIARYGSDQFPVTDEIAGGLLALGKKAVPKIFEALKSDATKHESKIVLLSILYHISNRDKAASSTIIPLIADCLMTCSLSGSDFTSIEAFLSRVGDASTLQTLTDFVRRGWLSITPSSIFSNTQRAIKIIGKISGRTGDKSAVPLLISLLINKVQRAMIPAMEALGEIGDISAEDLFSAERLEIILIELIENPESESTDSGLTTTAGPAAKALAKIGNKNTLGKLTQILSHELGLIDEGIISIVDIHAVIETIGDLSEKLGDKSAAPVLVKALKQSDEPGEHRYALVAARALGKIRDPSTADELYDVVKIRQARRESISEIGIVAAEALHNVGDPRGIESLFTMLRVVYTLSENHLLLRSTLARIGQPAVKPLLDAIKREEKDLFAGTGIEYGLEFLENTISVFVELKSAEVVDYLLGKLKDPNSLISLTPDGQKRKNKWGTKFTTDDLTIEALKVVTNYDPTNPEVYKKVKPVVSEIMQAITSVKISKGTSIHRQNIATGIALYLGKVSSLMTPEEKEEAAKLIVPVLDYPDVPKESQTEVIDVLVSMGEQAVGQITSVLRRESLFSVSGQARAIEVLGKIAKNTGSSEAILTLVDLLPRVESNNKQALGTALSNIGQPAVRRLIEFIDREKDRTISEPRGVRHAIRILGVIGGQKSIDFLIKIAAMGPEYDAVLKKEAIIALGEAKDPRAIPVLLEHLDTQLSPEAVEALEKLGQPAVKPLLEYIEKIQAKGSADEKDSQRITDVAGIVLKIRYNWNLGLESDQRFGLVGFADRKKSVSEFLEKLDGLIKTLKSEPTEGFAIDAERFDSGQAGVGLETERVLDMALARPVNIDNYINLCQEYCSKPGQRAIPAKLFPLVAARFVGRDGSVDKQSIAFLRSLFESTEVFKARFEKDRLAKSLATSTLQNGDLVPVLRIVEKNLNNGKYDKGDDGKKRRPRDISKVAMKDLNDKLETVILVITNKGNPIFSQEAYSNMATFLDDLVRGGEYRDDLVPEIKKAIVEAQTYKLYGQMVTKLGIDEETRRKELDILAKFLERNLESGQALLNDIEIYLQKNQDTEFWQNAREALVAHTEGKFSKWKYSSPDFVAFMKEVREKKSKEEADKLEREWKENTVYETADGFTVEITDDFETTFRIGTCPTRSCQAFDIGSHNYGLMAFVANGLNKIAILRDSSGRIIARRVVRLRMFSDPILHVEDQYANFAEWIDQALLLKGQAMGVSGILTNAKSSGQGHKGGFNLDFIKSGKFDLSRSSPIVTTYGGRATHNYYDSRGVGDVPLSAGETETYSFSAEILTDIDIAGLLTDSDNPEFEGLVLGVQKVDAGQSKKPIIDQIVQIHQTLGLKLPDDIRTKLFALSFDDLTDELNKLRAEAAEKLDVNKFLNRIAQFSVGAAPGSVAEFAVEVKIRDYITEGLLKNDLAEISRARELLDSIRLDLSVDVVEETELVLSEAATAILTRKPPEQIRRDDPETTFFRLDETLRKLGFNNKNFLDRPGALKSGTDYIIVGLLGEGESKFTLKIRLTDGTHAALHMPKSMDDQFDIQNFEKEISAAQNIYGAETESGRLGAEFLGEADLGYITTITDGKHLDEMTPDEILSLYSRGLIPKIIENARAKVHTLADLGYGDFDLQFLVSQDGEVTFVDPENVGSEDSYLFVSPNAVENKIRRIVETKLAELTRCELCIGHTQPSEPEQSNLQGLGLSTYKTLLVNVDALEILSAKPDPELTFDEFVDSMRFVTDDMRYEIEEIRKAPNTEPARRALIIQVVKKHYFKILTVDLVSLLIVTKVPDFNAETVRDVYERYNAIRQLASDPKDLASVTRAVKNGLESYGYLVDNVIELEPGEFVVSPITMAVLSKNLDKSEAPLGIKLGAVSESTKSRMRSELQDIGFSENVVSDIIKALQPGNILVSSGSRSGVTTYYHERYHANLQNTEMRTRLNSLLYYKFPPDIKSKIESEYSSIGYDPGKFYDEFWADYFAYMVVGEAGKLSYLSDSEMAAVENTFNTEFSKVEIEYMMNIVKGDKDPDAVMRSLKDAIRRTSGKIDLNNLKPVQPEAPPKVTTDDSPLTRFPSEGVGTPRADYLILRELQNLLEQAESTLDLTKIEEARTKLKEAQASQQIVYPEETIPLIENIISELETNIKTGTQLAEKAADILARTLNLEPIEGSNILSQEFNKKGQTEVTVNSMDGVKEMLEQYAPGTALVIVSKSFISSLPPEYTKTILGDPEGSSAQFRVGLLHAREYSDRFEIHRDAVDPRKQPIMHLWHDSPETLFGIVTGATTAGLATKVLWDTTSKIMDNIHAVPATVIPAALGAIVTGYATHVGGKVLRFAIKAYFEKRLREKLEQSELTPISNIPKGLTEEQFEDFSSKIRDAAEELNLPDDISANNIRVIGSSVYGEFREDSDYDLNIITSEAEFDTLAKFIQSKMDTRRTRDMKQFLDGVVRGYIPLRFLNIISNEEIVDGETKPIFGSIIYQLRQIIGRDIDISFVKVGSEFDSDKFIPLLVPVQNK